MHCVFILIADGKITIQENLKHIIQVDNSMLKEEYKIKEVIGFACHTVKSDVVSCLHENICYALDISTIAVESEPSNPVSCYVRNQVQLSTKGNSIY